MLKKGWRVVAHLEKFGDFAIILIAFLLAYYGRPFFIKLNHQFHLGFNFAGDSLAPLSDYALVVLVAIVSQTLLLNSLKAYERMRFRSFLQIAWIFFVSSSGVFFILASVLFLLKLDLSRSFVILFSLILLGLLLFERCVTLFFLRFIRRHGLNYRNIIICGMGRQAIQFSKKIFAHPELGFAIKSYVNLASGINYEDIYHFKQDLALVSNNCDIPVVCGLSSFEKLLNDSAIDEVVITDVTTVFQQVHAVMQLCADQGLRVTLLAESFSIGLATSQLSYFDGVPLIHFAPPPGDMWELGLKRGMDIVLSFILLVLLAPVLIVVALLVKFSSTGPVFYVQKRVGLNGHLFNFYKFRSMCQDADQQLAALKDKNEMKGPAFKMKNDPRITAVGKWLRRYSLDELPQLWNVLKGDMSLVGPRPPVPDEVRAYERRYRRRLSMRPGMTCTWQVSGRNDISDFSQWVALDLEYIDNWSIFNDFYLLLKTIPAVIFGRGAS